MMRIIGLLTIFIAAICLGVALHHDPGYVLIVLHHWTIETTLWIALLILALTFLTMYVVLRGFSALIHAPSRWQQWWQRRRARRALAKTQQGLIEFNEGQWNAAQKHLIAAAPYADMPFINYLTAAHAAEASGDFTRRDQYLHQAYLASPATHLAVGLVQAQFQINHQHWEQARSTLEHLYASAPNHPQILKLLIHLYQQQNHWQELYDLLPRMKHHKEFTSSEWEALRRQIYRGYFQHQVLTLPTTEITQWIKNLPKPLKRDPIILASYSRYLFSQQAYTLVESTLQRSLKSTLDDDLLDLYSQLPCDIVSIPFIESLIQSNPESAALHLCMAKIYCAQKLWGTAKDHIEKSIQISPSAQAYLVLGELCQSFGNLNAACKAYQQGLAQGCLMNSAYLTKTVYTQTIR